METNEALLFSRPTAVTVKQSITKLNAKGEQEGEDCSLVTPGTLITSDTGFIRGHGTLPGNVGPAALPEDTSLYATVGGVVERINKLVTVSSLKKARYSGQVGDVVVGRVTQVGHKRWKVDVYSHQDASLLLSSVNLPGGELRRRSAEDQLAMRDYLREGDVISAEVQKVNEEGAISLHTRSLKYGKLGQGVMVRVRPSLVLRLKTHFHNLPFGISVILGNNGYVWIAPTLSEEEGGNTGGFIQSSAVVERPTREGIARTRNLLLALAAHNVPISDTSLVYAYQFTTEEGNFVPIQSLLLPNIQQEVAELTKLKIYAST